LKGVKIYCIKSLGGKKGSGKGRKRAGFSLRGKRKEGIARWRQRGFREVSLLE